jgi:hypothetical protein
MVSTDPLFEQIVRARQMATGQIKNSCIQMVEKRGKFNWRQFRAGKLGVFTRSRLYMR